MKKLTPVPDLLPNTNWKPRKKPGVYGDEGGGEQLFQHATYAQHKSQTSAAARNKKRQICPDQYHPVANGEEAKKEDNTKRMSTL